MADLTTNQFRPNYAIPPGVTLQETLDSIGMTQAELAERTGRPKKTINGIIKGKTAITSETAIQLERALAIPAGFWMSLESQYQEILARLEEENSLEEEIAWMDLFPIKAMIRRGWIQRRETKVDQLKELLTFFGITSPNRWQEVWESMPASFRKSSSFEADPGAVTAWLRKGEVEAQRLDCAPYSAKRFKTALSKIRRLTKEPPEKFVGEMHKLCMDAGVACLFIQELPKIRAWGATRWLSPNRALIQLTLRYKTDDHLWFSFYHEAGHILLHGKKEVFLEDANSGQGRKEDDANRFAEDFLIPRLALQVFMAGGQKSKIAILKFASELGIAPGIVVGQLQHHKYLPMSHCNDLKRRFEWPESMRPVIRRSMKM